MHNYTGQGHAEATARYADQKARQNATTIVRQQAEIEELKDANIQMQLQILSATKRLAHHSALMQMQAELLAKIMNRLGISE